MTTFQSQTTAATILGGVAGGASAAMLSKAYARSLGDDVAPGFRYVARSVPRIAGYTVAGLAVGAGLGYGMGVLGTSGRHGSLLDTGAKAGAAIGATAGAAWVWAALIQNAQMGGLPRDHVGLAAVGLAAAAIPGLALFGASLGASFTNGSTSLLS